MAKTSFFGRPSVMLALALASVSLVVTLMGKLAGGPASQEQKRVAISGGAGSESYPSLSPDGKRVAYSQRESSKNGVWHVFVRDLPGGTPKQLSRGEENDIAPVWSPDGGTLAFQRIGEDKVEYIVIPADGGAERRVTEFTPAPSAANPVPAVSWLPDGKSLVVVQPAEDKPSALATVTLSSGKVERITSPPDGTEGDSMPAVSPAGDTLAFVRGTSEGSGDIWVSELQGGNPRRVTFDDHAIRGMAWTRDGQELIYSARRTRGWHLWRIPAGGGSPRDIAIAGESANYPAVARNRLAYTDSPTASAIWRAPLGGDAAGDERLLIRSSGREGEPSYSPDALKIATVSEEADSQEIFLQDADGKNRVQITHMNRPWINHVRWSADSKQLIFETRGDQGSDVYVMGAVPGAQPARVATSAGDASFSQNGKSIYYQSRGQIWRAGVNGSNPVVIVPMRGGVSQPMETLDGKYVIFRMRRSLWRIPATGGEPEEFLVPEQDMLWTSIQPAKKGIYFMVWERSTRGTAVVYYDYATKKSTPLTRSSGFDRGGAAFSVSPDGKYILYPKVDRSQTNLMLVESFK
jgi:Tol biopolymer transport system component